ncbi:MAG TPA: PaaI family thioesterase [Gammaproteobacteria bacterium]
MAVPIKRDSQTFSGCFGCGTDNPVGLRLKFERDGDSVVSRGMLAREYAGYEQFVHGGVVATLLDEAMGWALLHVAGRYGVTRSLRIDYRRPVAVERLIIVRASVVEVDVRTTTLASSVEDERGRVLAAAEGEWATVRKERARGDSRND